MAAGHAVPVAHVWAAGERAGFAQDALEAEGEGLVDDAAAGEEEEREAAREDDEREVGDEQEDWAEGEEGQGDAERVVRAVDDVREGEVLGDVLDVLLLGHGGGGGGGRGCG